MIDISQVRWAAEFDIPKSMNLVPFSVIRDVKCEILCVSKLTNVKVKRWHLICHEWQLLYTMFWMNDRNSIYLKKLNRCTRSRLTGSSSIVRIHSDFTVRDSYMTRWVEHGCAWVIHAKYEQQIYYAYAVDIYDVWFDLRLAEALMYIICWVCFVCKSPVRLLPKRREFETGDMKHWKWSRTQVWYHLVFFFSGLV